MTTKTEQPCFFCNKREGQTIPIFNHVLFGATPDCVAHFVCLQEAYKDVQDRNA